MFNLQNTIEINGIDYPIDTDFRVWLKFQNLIKELKENEESFIKLLSFFIEIGLDFNINFLKEALEQCVSFFIGEKNNNNSTVPNFNQKKTFDFKKDEKYIYSAFLQEYNIDLYNIQQLHWHKFKSLLESLSSECQLSKIIQYRSIELSKIKDKEQKNFYSKMKKIYSLDDIKLEKYENLEEAEKAFLEEINRRHKEAERIINEKGGETNE